MEDYKKKYEEAVKQMVADGQISQEVAEKYFPELKEEDEDELTWLTRYIKKEADCLSDDIRDDEDRAKLKNLQKSIAWLEMLSDRNPADGVYPEAGGVRIWKNGHTFLVPRNWGKGEWPLLNDKGCWRSKESNDRLMNEIDALLDWDFIAATKHIQDLGTDIPLKEGEYMLTAPVWLAMYEYRDALNKALRDMGAKEINFDEDCWFAQRYSTYSAWLFNGTCKPFYSHTNVPCALRVVFISI